MCRLTGEVTGARDRSRKPSAELLALAPSGRGPCHSRRNGFDLHAAATGAARTAVLLRTPSSHRDRPAAPDRRRAGDARSAAPMGGRDHAAPVRADGAARTAGGPHAAPRINLLLYYRVLGARSAWRSRLQACEPKTSDRGGRGTTAVESSSRATPIPSRTNWLWAALMRRSFGFDVLTCPRCADRLELIALIEDPTVIRRILKGIFRQPTA